MQGVTLATLRGDLGRIIGDWNDPTHCTSQQQVTAAEQQTDRLGSHLSTLALADYAVSIESVMLLSELCMNKSASRNINYT